MADAEQEYKKEPTDAGAHPGQFLDTGERDVGYAIISRLSRDAAQREAGWQIKARVYVAGAIEDQSFPDDMKARLENALTGAGVDHTVETYPAKHGWVMRDTPVYNAVAAERHWKTHDLTRYRRARRREAFFPRKTGQFDMRGNCE